MWYQRYIKRRIKTSMPTCREASVPNTRNTKNTKNTCIRTSIYNPINHILKPASLSPINHRLRARRRVLEPPPKQLPSPFVVVLIVIAAEHAALPPPARAHRALQPVVQPLADALGFAARHVRRAGVDDAVAEPLDAGGEEVDGFVEGFFLGYKRGCGGVGWGSGREEG